MPAPKVDESELVKLELSTTAAERASELTGTAVASLVLPKYSKASHGSVGVPTSIFGDVVLTVCGQAIDRGEPVQRRMQETLLETPYPR